MGRKKTPPAFEDVLRVLAQTLQEEHRLLQENQHYWRQLQQSRNRLRVALTRLSNRILQGKATPQEEALYLRCLKIQAQQFGYQEILERIRS